MGSQLSREGASGIMYMGDDRLLKRLKWESGSNVTRI